MLTTGYWPTQTVIHPCILPGFVREAYESFRQFYLNKHSGRQLTLQPSLGSADLTSMFYGKIRDEEPENECRPTTTTATKERKHTLQVSTYQMVILMLFNSKDSWSYEVNHLNQSSIISFFSFRKFNNKQILMKKIFIVRYYRYLWVK